MSNSNIFGDDSDVDDLDANDSILPFPKPLDRAAFLEADFSAAKFLSSLNNRFQTLEDLQAELQDLLKGLNKELVDLVNDNYTDFLSLGDRLRGGEERIEEIRVGLLGFQRDVTGVRDLVSQRSDEVKKLLQIKTTLRKEIQVGRILLEVDERLEDLEYATGVRKSTVPPPSVVGEHNTLNAEDADLSDNIFKDWGETWTKDDASDFDTDDSSEGDEIEAGLHRELPSRLARNLEDFQAIQALADKCGKTHPFLLAQRDRVAVVRDILRRRIETEIRNQPEVQVKQRLIQLRTKIDDE